MHADNGYQSWRHPATARRRNPSINHIQPAHATGLPQCPNQVHVAVDEGYYWQNEAKQRPDVTECHVDSAVEHERAEVENVEDLFLAFQHAHLQPFNIPILLDQELIPVTIRLVLVLVGATALKSLRLRRFKSDQDEITRECFSHKYASIDVVRFSL